MNITPAPTTADLTLADMITLRRRAIRTAIGYGGEGDYTEKLAAATPCEVDFFIRDRD